MAGDEPTDSRGVKRKLDQTLEPPRRIRPLDADVINKIAAGEIIVAPVNALKELTENAIDAGATSIEILVKDGGLKLLQITDDGCGINRDDMPILCERFTTSKLQEFEDLQSIGTYGFRGEALASISHIAHLQITTRTRESSCAWRANYASGKLAPPKPGQDAEPKPCAGRQGTQIAVEDMFFNVPTRRRAFRSASEEYSKILDMIGRYAVHCDGVAFSCKKHGDAAMGLSVLSSASTTDRIRQIHGSHVANELIQFDCASTRWGFKSTGLISNANYHVKKLILLLFINHRAVESSVIKKAIEQTYSTFLPKGGHPFVYLSLEIEPSRVDVNVHPTKREVRFLHEDEAIDEICEEMRVCLGKVDTSRTFMTQTLLPGVKIPTIIPLGNNSPQVRNQPAEEEDSSSAQQISRSNMRRNVAQRPNENNLVRTDSKARKITSMLPSARRTESYPDQGSHEQDEDVDEAADVDEMDYELTGRKLTPCKLTSVKQLRASVRGTMHDGLTETFATHTFVGVVDERRRLATIQSGVKLLMVDYGLICNEYFYQLALTDFGNFGVIRLRPPLNLRELLELGVEREDQESANNAAVDWQKVIVTIENQLLARREMLQEYFSLEINSDGQIEGLPLLVKGYMPCMAKLPSFLLGLGPRVDWQEEIGCFRTFCRELASWYVPEALPPAPKSTGKESVPQVAEDPLLSARRAEIRDALEHVLFPAMKAEMIATKAMLPGVVEIANLKGLYRVFERC